MINYPEDAGAPAAARSSRPTGHAASRAAERAAGDSEDQHGSRGGSPGGAHANVHGSPRAPGSVLGGFTESAPVPLSAMMERGLERVMGHHPAGPQEVAQERPGGAPDGQCNHRG
ncbi:hypothetical protein GPECTOR_7g1191 [Gonium pectorale]|uniref:Uncharacterized protein n=1 Tax=Gonium pectorale TaxID=33097 RepID=A0A150GTV8_GONPE|nr:hypothetical protein GPECTOR_7g1191 [Gonium pectorale]|eukprot:KXZ53297.1 hypothetical protein GPECTOR_7g1191 [Gonium pectorale]